MKQNVIPGRGRLLPDANPESHHVHLDKIPGLRCKSAHPGMTASCYDMLDLLFVYGTLMRGYDHPMARLLSAHAAFVGDATCRGRLHLVRHYPGLLLSNDPADIVHGELYRLSQPEVLLRELDMYEACGEGFAEPTEYLRQMLPVTSGDGAVHEAWTYIYNWPVDGLPVITSGRFGVG